MRRRFGRHQHNLDVAGLRPEMSRSKSREFCPERLFAPEWQSGRRRFPCEAHLWFSWLFTLASGQLMFSACRATLPVRIAPVAVAAESAGRACAPVLAFPPAFLGISMFARRSFTRLLS